MTTIFRMMRLATVLFAVVAFFAGNANAQGACPDDGKVRAACTKELRIWNNTDSTIYAVLQGSKQLTDALNCTLADKGGGDVWLQAALGDTKDCHRVNNTYFAYINPRVGIPPNSFVSVNVPWWSKRKPGAPDLYIDWWRGARVFIFDDQNALNDSYRILKKTPQVEMATNSPVVACNRKAEGNTCRPGQLEIYQVTQEAEIAATTPFQLNEFTFADVTAVTDNGTAGGAFVDFNQNYNVSNVDQAYLPVAIQPVREPADIGYMGTTMSVKKFRQQLAAFTGADINPKKPTKWPIYNNPTVRGQPLYPKAGIRVPSTQTVLDFYMNPGFFPPPSGAPLLIPANNPPPLIDNLLNQWTNCTAADPRGCPDAKIYQEINQAFADSYAVYLKRCKNVPDFLKPVAGTNPPAPTLFAFLRFVYGWVPFNTCDPAVTVPDLPTINQSRAPIDYINVQYNYLDHSLVAKQWFNAYAQLIHGDVAAGGLAANAYAFSIDDHSSFQSNNGGSTPGGLILAVGGDNGLPNKTQIPPPVPPVYRKFGFSVSLGAPSAGGAQWERYGICNDSVTTLFPGSADGAYAIGLDPAFEKISADNPCPITLTDTKKRKYQLVVLKAKVPPDPIWPDFKASAGRNFDPKVVKCPALDGFVPPDQWCNFLNETADPTQKPPVYDIGTRGPLN